MLDIFGNTFYSQAKLNTTADFNWHYVCVDLHAALKAYDSTFTTAASLLKLMSVSVLRKIFLNLYLEKHFLSLYLNYQIKATVAPLYYNMYIDVVSIRNSLPLGYNGKYIIKNKKY